VKLNNSWKVTLRERMKESTGFTGASKLLGTLCSALTNVLCNVSESNNFMIVCF